MTDLDLTLRRVKILLPNSISPLKKKEKSFANNKKNDKFAVMIANSELHDSFSRNKN